MKAIKTYDQIRTELLARGMEKGMEKGVEKGELSVIVRMVSRRLGRELSAREQSRVSRRVAKRGATTLEEALLEGDTKTIERWVAPPSTKRSPPVRTSRAR